MKRLKNRRKNYLLYKGTKIINDNFRIGRIFIRPKVFLKTMISFLFII